MGTLYLVRHGQASFGAANYDQLSALGQRQSHQPRPVNRAFQFFELPARCGMFSFYHVRPSAPFVGYHPRPAKDSGFSARRRRGGVSILSLVGQSRPRSANESGDAVPATMK